RRADGRADDGRLRDRRVDDPALAELLDQAVGHLERAAVDADVLAQQEHALVACHLLAEALADRVDVGGLALRDRRHAVRAEVRGCVAHESLFTMAGSISTTAPFA